MLCNIYKDSFDNKSVHFVEVDKVIDGIRTGRWGDRITALREAKTKKEKDSIKIMLPCVTFSGTFEQRSVYSKKKGHFEMISKRDEHLKDYSGLMVIDIDKINDKESSRIKKLFKDDDFLYCAFDSPSLGLKLLYEVDAESKYHKTASFEQVKEHVELLYNVQVDASGKNISRLCYVSYDPNIYVNNEYICFPVDTEKYERDFNKPIVQLDNLMSQDNVSYDLDYIWNVIKKWMDNKGMYYVVGNRNEYLYKVSCCLNRAGVSEHQIIQLISKNHSINKDMYAELLAAVSSACTRHKGEFGNKPVREKNSNLNRLI